LYCQRGAVFFGSGAQKPALGSVTAMLRSSCSRVAGAPSHAMSVRVSPVRCAIRSRSVACASASGSLNLNHGRYAAGRSRNESFPSSASIATSIDVNALVVLPTP
jgi:hypothetical protein